MYEYVHLAIYDRTTSSTDFGRIWMSEYERSNFTIAFEVVTNMWLRLHSYSVIYSIKQEHIILLYRRIELSELKLLNYIVFPIIIKFLISVKRVKYKQ